MSEVSNRRGYAIIDEDVQAIIDAIGASATAFSGKTVFITGASGALPAYMVETFAALNDRGVLQNPCQMLLLVRNPQSGKDRLSHLIGRSDTRFVYADVSEPFQFPDHADYVVYAASPASPKSYRDDPVGCLDANIMGLRATFERALAWKVSSFLYFSSSEIYGNPEATSIPTPESYVGRVDPLEDRACYSEAKRAGEAYCHAFFARYGLPVKIVRPFHIYGPGFRPDDGRIFPTLIDNAVRGDSFSLLSEGRATRSFGYISDATVDFFNVLLSEADGEAFNVGNDEEISIFDLATLVSAVSGRNDPVHITKSQSAEHLTGAPDRACPDLSKIRSAFEYLPRVGLEEGIRRSILWRQLIDERPSRF